MLCLCWMWLQGSFYLVCYLLLGGWNIVIDVGGDGGEDSCFQCVVLIGGDNLQWMVQYVVVGLYDDLVFLCDIVKCYDVVNWDFLFGEVFYNGVSVEGGGGDQIVEQCWCVGGQVKVGDYFFQVLVGIWCVVVVELVEYYWQMFQ